MAAMAPSAPSTTGLPVRRMPASAILVVPGTVFLLVMLIGPLLRGFGVSLGWGETDFPSLESYVRVFSQEFYLGVLWRTVWISLLVVVILAFVGYPVAYRLVQLNERARKNLYLLLLAPLLVSHAVISFGWLVILSRNGLLDQLLMSMGVIQSSLRILFTETAIVIGLVQIFVPYMIVSIAASLTNIDPRVVLAARNLGAGPWTTFRRIILPLSLPGLVSGCTIVFTLSMSAFATPAFLGGTSVRMMSSLAYQQAMLVLDWRFAGALSFILLATSGVVLIVSTSLVERSRSAKAMQ